MAVKKVFKFVIITIILIILLFLLGLNILGVFWKGEGVGFGFLKEDGEMVQYSYINHIVNVSMFPKTVTFEAFSYEDAESSFIKEPELNIISLGIYSNDPSKDPEDIYYLPENIMILQPFEEYDILIECEGEYGGNGSGVRHPPDTINIKRWQE